MNELAVFRALAARDLLVQRSYRLSLAFDVFWGVVNVVLYYFISRVVGTDPGADLGSARTYFEFALAGILMALVIGSATSDVASRVREEELTGTLEALCAQPVGSRTLVLGWSAFPLVYALGRAAVYLALAVLVLDVSAAKADWAGVVVILVAAALAFLPLGVLAAAATVAFKRGETIVGLGVFAMTLLGGAYFPLSVLPGWLEWVGRVMPTRFAFDGLRGALYGGDWTGSALALAAVAVVAVPAALWVFARALERARRDGSLAQY